MYEINKVREECLYNLERKINIQVNDFKERKERGVSTEFPYNNLQTFQAQKENFEEYFEEQLKQNISNLIEAIQIAIQQSPENIRNFKEGKPTRLAFVALRDDGFTGPLGASYLDPLVKEIIDYSESVKGYLTNDKKEEFKEKLMNHYGYTYSNLEKNRS